MFRYPDGQFRQTLPTSLTEGDVRYSTKGWTMAQWNEKGYNEAIPLRKDPEYTYATHWVKDELLYREENVTAPVFREAELFPVYQENKQSEIKSTMDSLLAPVAARFSTREQQGWSDQLADAKAFEASPTAATPNLDLIVAETGEQVADLAADILANDVAWRGLVMPMTGQRQNFSNQLNAATTCAEIEAIDVAYVVPSI